MNGRAWSVTLRRGRFGTYLYWTHGTMKVGEVPDFVLGSAARGERVARRRLARRIEQQRRSTPPVTLREAGTVGVRRVPGAVGCAAAGRSVSVLREPHASDVVSRLGPFDGYGKPRRRPNTGAGGRIIGRREVAAPPHFTPPPPPRKTDCAGHVAGRDDLGRYPIGDCGTDCLMRRFRLGLAEWDGERWR